MKVACIQMDMLLGKPEENFAHAEELITKAMEGAPDVLVLPETWNVGFFPRENLADLCDRDGAQVKARIGALAKKFSVGIVAGSVGNLSDGKVYNTCMVFDRLGDCIASYDKTHLFSPMEEDRYFQKGDHVCRFTLDKIPCGVIICYDLRFPELARRLAVEGTDVLFVVSQWPKERLSHLRSLTVARAIENQMFVVCCNSCGTAGKTVYGGSSAIIDPWGETLALAGEREEILTAACDETILKDIRGAVPVFRDRRVDIYQSIWR